MKKICIVFVLILVFVCSSFAFHKFYTAIYQIEFIKDKKEIQITSRIFLDDFNDALEKKYNKKNIIQINAKASKETELVEKYLDEHFKIKANNQLVKMSFVQLEIEDNVVICYSVIKNMSKINSLEVQNSILTELHADQQNIIQLKWKNKKQSALLTLENTKSVFK